MRSGFIMRAIIKSADCGFARNMNRIEGVRDTLMDKTLL